MTGDNMTTDERNGSKTSNKGVSPKGSSASAKGSSSPTGLTLVVRNTFVELAPSQDPEAYGCDLDLSGCGPMSGPARGRARSDPLDLANGSERSRQNSFAGSQDMTPQMKSLNSLSMDSHKEEAGEEEVAFDLVELESPSREGGPKAFQSLQLPESAVPLEYPSRQHSNSDGSDDTRNFQSSSTPPRQNHAGECEQNTPPKQQQQSMPPGVMYIPVLAQGSPMCYHSGMPNWAVSPKNIEIAMSHSGTSPQANASSPQMMYYMASWQGDLTQWASYAGTMMTPMNCTMPAEGVNAETYNFSQESGENVQYSGGVWAEQGTRPEAENPRTEQDENEQRTTVMIRNLPNDYTRDMLMELLDEQGFLHRYDFIYMPIDFSRRAGLGYAFVNMCTPQDAQEAHQVLQGFDKWKMPSAKVLEISWSHPSQGLEAHIERYRNSPVMHPDVPQEFKPLLFKDGKLVAFPGPTKRIRLPRLKHCNQSERRRNIEAQ